MQQISAKRNLEQRNNSKQKMNNRMKKTVIPIVAAVLMTLSAQAQPQVLGNSHAMQRVEVKNHSASRSKEPLSAAASTGT